MESAMQELSTRRRTDGSIDIGFCRDAGPTERRLAMTDFARGAKKLHRGVIAVLLLAAAIYMAPSRDGAGWNEASVTARHNGAFLQPLSTSAQLYAMRAAQR
jgi:hypothetical protein